MSWLQLHRMMLQARHRNVNWHRMGSMRQISWGLKVQALWLRKRFYKRMAHRITIYRLLFPWHQSSYRHSARQPRCLLEAPWMELWVASTSLSTYHRTIRNHLGTLEGPRGNWLANRHPSKELVRPSQSLLRKVQNTTAQAPSTRASAHSLSTWAIVMRPQKSQASNTPWHHRRQLWLTTNRSKSRT